MKRLAVIALSALVFMPGAVGVASAHQLAGPAFEPPEPPDPPEPREPNDPPDDNGAPGGEDSGERGADGPDGAPGLSSDDGEARSVAATPTPTLTPEPTRRSVTEEAARPTVEDDDWEPIVALGASLAVFLLAIGALWWRHRIRAHP